MVQLDKAPYDTALKLFKSDNYEYVIMALKCMTNDLDTFKDFLKETFEKSHVYTTKLETGDTLYVLDYMIEIRDKDMNRRIYELNSEIFQNLNKI